MIIYKSFKFRIYPNEEQKQRICKTFGCVRFVYNQMLTDKLEGYYRTGRPAHVTPAQYKAKYPWLANVDAMALCDAQLKLQDAFAQAQLKNDIGSLKYRVKKAYNQSYETRRIKNNIRISGTRIRLPKVGEVKIKIHRTIPAEYILKSVTVKKEKTNKYYACLLFEYDVAIQEKPLKKSNAIGLDYSSPYLYVDSNGHSADSPHPMLEYKTRLAKEERKLAHMKFGSKNFLKQRAKIARIYDRMHNIRYDWLQKQSTKLANNYDYICIEDLSMADMSKHFSLGSRTYDNSFCAFKMMLEYKLKNKGGRLITINKWFPSSKLCSSCGHHYKQLSIINRVWICPECGTVHDRDCNAANNILKEGLKQMNKTAGHAGLAC